MHLGRGAGRGNNLHHGMVEAILIGIVSGMAGFLVCGVLTRTGEVLAWWPGLVRRLTATKSQFPDDWNGLQFFVHKITWLCAKCCAGWIAIIFLTAFPGNILVTEIGHGVATVVVAVFSAFAIEKHYEG